MEGWVDLFYRCPRVPTAATPHRFGAGVCVCLQVWGLQSPQAHFTLEGHEKGVNCLDYFSGGEKP